MSEYQYYEFLAIDRPLTPEEMASLRASSSRARITPVSFSNEYHWGGFKGNPVALMREYFDVHVYVADWGAAILMVRLPIEALSRETAEAMTTDTLEFKATPTHWVITWSLDESENYDRSDMEEGEGWMARLAAVRDELLRGDIRALYIGWLAAVTQEMVDDDDLEPLCVDGLQNLTAAQQALAEFLQVDEDLLAGAGIGGPAASGKEPSPRETNDWLDGLPRKEIHGLLKQLLDGRSAEAERTLRNHYNAWRQARRDDQGQDLRRTVTELWENAAAAEKIRLAREKQDQKRLAQKQRQERDAYLGKLAADFPKAWKAVEQAIKRGSGLAYNEACQDLIDLAEAYAAHASRKSFQQELQRFMAPHLQRKALIQRLVKAGLWKEA